MQDPSDRTPHPPTVAVVGGGLAGMAAAAAAAAHGLRVELFERARSLGGRAGSFRDPRSGQLIDFCPHVAMGCCTHLADFCRRSGLCGDFRRYGQLHFFGPEGRRWDFSASRWLPAPLHLLPGLLRLGYLGRREQWSIARTLLRLARLRPDDCRDETAGAWLREQGQTDRAIERFWSVVLLSALSETAEHASLRAARKVFVDGFLASRHAYEVLVPQVPLGQLWQHAGASLAGQGVTVRLGAPIRRIEGDHRGVTGLVFSDGLARTFDFVVAAVSWRQIRSLLAPSLLSALPALEHVDQLESSPITAVHLWFDRPITPLPHAALIGRLSQWVFADPRPAADYHYAVVISASRALIGRGRQAVLTEVLGDLEAVWPAAREARLVRRQVLTRPAAVFSARPGVDRLRPAQQTPVENLFLAGDWTATGWPATMESAVRSGYQAVECLLHSLGRPGRVQVTDEL